MPDQNSWTNMIQFYMILALFIELIVIFNYLVEPLPLLHKIFFFWLPAVLFVGFIFYLDCCGFMADFPLDIYPSCVFFSIVFHVVTGYFALGIYHQALLSNQLFLVLYFLLLFITPVFAIFISSIIDLSLSKIGTLLERPIEKISQKSERLNKKIFSIFKK